MPTMRWKLAPFAAALALVSVAGVAAAQNNPTITLNESGSGTLLFPGGSPITTTGTLAADPGPGGLPSALTFNLLGPPSLVAGDLLIYDAGGATLSDVIRFNPAGTSSGYPASAVFYSMLGGGALADVGFPTSFYANAFSMIEGPTGSFTGVTYTPTAAQPGYVAGFSVTYVIQSDAMTTTPEPATWALAGTGLVLLGGVARRRRRA